MARKQKTKFKAATTCAVARFLKARGFALSGSVPSLKSVASALFAYQKTADRPIGKGHAKRLITEFASQIGAEAAPKPKAKRRGRFTAEYVNHLKSKEWVEFRASIISARGATCEDCGASSGLLHLHHLTYENMGHELPEDVKLLCIPCHEKTHGRTINRRQRTKRAQSLPRAASPLARTASTAEHLAGSHLP